MCTFLYFTTLKFFSNPSTKWPDTMILWRNMVKQVWKTEAEGSCERNGRKPNKFKDIYFGKVSFSTKIMRDSKVNKHWHSSLTSVWHCTVLKSRRNLKISSLGHQLFRVLELRHFRFLGLPFRVTIRKNLKCKEIEEEGLASKFSRKAIELGELVCHGSALCKSRNHGVNQRYENFQAYNQ